MPKKKNLQTQNKGNKKKKKKKAKEEGEKVEKGKDEKEEEVQEEEEKEKGEDRDPNEGDDCGKEEEEEEVILLKPNTGLMKIQTKDVMTTIEEEDVEDDFCPSLSKSLVFEAKNKSVLSPDAKPFVMKPNSTSKSSFFRSSLNLETVYENKIISTTMDINKNLILGNKIPFESPQPGPVLKHPLSHSWTFWWFTGERRSWEDNMVQVMSFDTIEDFWSLYHHVILPSELKSGQDYFLFKNGIKPMWEDEANHRGGSWRFAQERKHKIEHLDKRWLELSIFVVGEDFNTYGVAGDDAIGLSDIICGAVVSTRKSADRLSLWLSNIEDEKRIKELGRILTRVYRLCEEQFVVFASHEDTRNRTGSGSPPYIYRERGSKVTMIS